MAVQAFFSSGVLTVHSGNATPDAPEYADDAVGDPSAPMECANNLKQIAIAFHALDAGACSDDICGQNSPVTHAGWGLWEVVSSGHGSSAGGDFGHADMLFGAADHPPLSEDLEIAWLEIAWVSGDGGTRDHGSDVVPITNLTGVNGPSGDHGTSILEFSVENFPNNSPDVALDGFGIDRGHMAGSFELTFATQTTSPQRGGNAVATESLEIAHEGFQEEPEAVTWTAIAMAESGGNMGSYGDYFLYDLIV
jgi:hypothetical protein